MAVFTNLQRSEIKNILNDYDLGKLVKFNGIKEGIENTNYFIKTSQNKFILTIFEKRVKNKDVPFFVKLMDMMHAKGFKCPRPIRNIHKKSIFKIKNNYRIRLLLRSPINLFPQKQISQALKLFKVSKKIKLTVDVDPLNFS